MLDTAEHEALAALKLKFQSLVDVHNTNGKGPAEWGGQPAQDLGKNCCWLVSRLSTEPSLANQDTGSLPSSVELKDCLTFLAQQLKTQQ
jgi:hypothetical protein